MASSSPRLLIRRAALPALCLLVAGYFGVHALTGPAGLLALEDIRADRTKLVLARAALSARQADLERDIALLDPSGADPDFADELVRRHLGVIRPDEVIVPLGPVSEPRRQP
jgi:cell division protein FtsB